MDFTGYWVSVVTEDWRWRMVTPARGDFAGVPLNAAARKVGQAWDPAKDEAEGNQCKAYGAAGIMRMPGRLHITWQDDTTLKIDTDQGTQTRVLHFGGKPAPGIKPSWQGYSSANWEGPQRGSAPPDFLPIALNPREGTRGRSLEVVTTNLRAGYLRKNGVPYSENTVLREVLRSLKRAQRRHVVRRDDDRRGPDQSHAAVRHEHELQKTGGRERVHAYGVLRSLNSQFPTPNYQPLPTPNLQALATGHRWELVIGSGWKLGVGRWELTKVTSPRRERPSGY